MTQNPQFSGVLFGAAYYAEYQEAGTLDRDLDLMVEAGFTVIRVGESVWSTWEPRNGEFDLDWLQPVLDGAHERGISVILGTPTYAIPPWLQTLHPEIAAIGADGHAIGWGARQEMDQSIPVYRWYAERIIRKVVARYADHPAVIGYQVDNEPGNNLAHNEATFQAFVAWLRTRYGTVERLNEEWGLVYWSHRIAEWSELWRPGGNLMPQYQLEWRRFQGELATDLIAWQAAIVREYARDDQFVTTCISYSRPQISDDELAASLDITAGNPYYLMQDGLSADVDLPRRVEWWHSGPWALFQWGDRAFSSAQERFLVTETNAQSIGGPWQNQPPYPGQIKQAAFALISRGARMIEYWHWHTLHFGVETYWGGILPHSQRPGRIYREVAELGASLKRIGGALDGFDSRRRRPDALLHRHQVVVRLLPAAGDRRRADRTGARTRTSSTRSTAASARSAPRCACSTLASSSSRRQLPWWRSTQCSLPRRSTWPMTRPLMRFALTPRRVDISCSASAPVTVTSSRGPVVASPPTACTTRPGSGTTSTATSPSRLR